MRITFFAVLIVLIVPFTYANDVEFNEAALEVADRGKVNLSNFSNSSYVPPGTYLLDLKINGKIYYQREFTYIKESKSQKSNVCIDDNLFESMDLYPNISSLFEKNSLGCWDMESNNAVNIKMANGALDIKIPQAWQRYSDPDWVPPSRWENGINGAITDYSLSSLWYNNDGVKKHSLSSYGQSGINIGAWRFRTNYQYSNSKSNQEIDWKTMHAYRPIPQIQSRIDFGELYLNSNIIDSFQFVGVNLSTDERMLPPSIRGYAPEVYGIAKTNAKVTITQNERVIYETTVPAGPFTINDLRSSTRGTLDVKIEESDGSINKYQVEATVVPYLTRPGHIRYNTSIGYFSQGELDKKKRNFVTGDLSYGLSNKVSGYGGALISDDYQLISLGLARDLGEYGAASADITDIVYQLNNKQSTGASYRFSYSKTFEKLKSTITFAGYKFSSKSFMTVQQFINETKRNERSSPMLSEKNLYSISLNKRFFDDNEKYAFQAYLNYNYRNYWQGSSQKWFGASLSKSFDIFNIRGVSLNLGLSKMGVDSARETFWSLSANIPFDFGESIRYELRTDEKSITNNASYSNFIDSNNSYQIGTTSKGNDVGVNGSYHNTNAITNVDVNFHAMNANDSTIGATFRGGITATQHGVAMHNSNNIYNAPRIMVDTQGVADVPFNAGKAKTNFLGLGVVTDFPSYSTVSTRIDVDSLEYDVQSNKSMSVGTLTEGAIGYRKFEVSEGKTLVAIVKLDEGQSPPFGAEYRNENGTLVAMQNDDEVVYLTGVKENEHVSVLWGSTSRCKVVIPAQFNENNKVLLPCH